MSHARNHPALAFGRRFLLALLVGHTCFLIARPCFATDVVIDSVMYRDPALPGARIVKKLPARLPALWVEALERPETDMKCQASQAIALAHERGFPGMEVAVGPLVRELVRPDQHATVRVAVVRALIVLDAKAEASLLEKAATLDPDLRHLVDPALARWDYKPARAEWLVRLNQSSSRRDTLLAIQSLATVREDKASSRLREMAIGRSVPAAIRIEAARSLGTIRSSGLEKDAQALAIDKTPRGKTDRLIAVSLLRQHQGDEAVQLLQSLGGDAEPAVAAIALARLVELDPKLVVPLLDSLLASADASVRGYGVDALFRQPTDARIRLLGNRLNDSHPDIRVQARKALLQLAAKREWRDAAIREGNRLLGGSDWRGLEQAAILLAQLDHKPAAGRLLKLLDHARPEVFVTVAWSLQQLSVPETLAPTLDYFAAQYKLMFSAGRSAGRDGVLAGDVDRQLSLLAQFLGQGRYREADAFLRKLIPQATEKGNPAGPEARAGAVWALGLIHEDKPVPELVQAMIGRLTAVRPFDIEDNRVRRMTAVAIARMKAQDGLPTLREFYIGTTPSLDVVNNACGWAIEQITGEKAPPPGTIEVIQLGWFLVPTN